MMLKEMPRYHRAIKEKMEAKFDIKGKNFQMSWLSNGDDILVYFVCFASTLLGTRGLSTKHASNEYK